MRATSLFSMRRALFPQTLPGILLLLLLAESEIAPPGRYCGTLVITLDSDGKSQFAFNEIPETH